MPLKDLISVQNVPVTVTRACYRMDPAVPMAWMIGPNKLPLKVHGLTEVEVPIHYWETPQEETEAIIRVMASMAEGCPIGVVDVEALTRAFWTKLRFNHVACIFNPALHGKFFMPERTVGYRSELVATNRILCLGRPGKLGTLLSQRNRSGYILPIHKGIVTIRLYNEA
jgi:hypothetical protein